MYAIRSYYVAFMALRLYVKKTLMITALPIGDCCNRRYGTWQSMPLKPCRVADVSIWGMIRKALFFRLRMTGPGCLRKSRNNFV